MPRPGERDARNRLASTRRSRGSPRSRFCRRRFPLRRALLLRRAYALPLLRRPYRRECLVSLPVALLLLQPLEPEVRQIRIVVRADAVVRGEGESTESEFDEGDAEGPDVGFDRVGISRDAFGLR